MLIYFILYLFIEVMVSSAIAGSIGGFLTFIELILSAVIGVTILQNFRVSMMENLSKVREGKLTQEEFLQANIGKMIGAILLIVPGFFTDILGVLLQFSSFIIIISKFIKFAPTNMNNTNYENYNNRTTFTYTAHTEQTNHSKKGDEDEIIDVEIIDHNSHIK